MSLRVVVILGKEKRPQGALHREQFITSDICRVDDLEPFLLLLVHPTHPSFQPVIKSLRFA